MAERRVEYLKLNRGKSVGIRIEAPSLQRIYLDMALAFFDNATSGSRTPPEETLRERVELSAVSSKDLLDKWVESIRALYVEKKMVASRAVFERFDGKTLIAVLHGAPYTPLHHGAIRTITKTESTTLSTEGPLEKPFTAEWLWTE